MITIKYVLNYQLSCDDLGKCFTFDTIDAMYKKVDEIKQDKKLMFYNCTKYTIDQKGA